MNELTDQAALQAVIDVLTYKPGWRFWVKVRPSAFGFGLPDVILHIEFDAPDANEPERMTIIGRDQILPPGLSQLRAGELAGIRQWVIHSIKFMETHEIDEWIRFDGVRAKNPHEPLKSPS